ncbi:MAG: DNA polymerase III subunit gamma/tau [Gammaproteobacteria bacterium]|nr:DNA polymerase III subunit gamma/tau [Gammaproteobacteria bacterium]MCZ6854015.1 DNA polymerase III subunit gamma/tau [Gammaproteobacteria bacterium]
MSYQVLARKLRPMNFEALVGQEHVVRALRHALDNDRLHHAYLFTGTRGVGKTTIARLLAKCLNCETGVSSTPCGKCSVCLEVAENRFIDLIEVDAASRTRVDDTRDLLQNAQYLPTRGRYKVYLIDEVHMLSASSFNALLKTLEEPPEHVKFLLATTDPKKVPVTVLSRCLQFQLKNIPQQRIAEYLTEVLTNEGIEFEGEALTVIAGCAAGSMRDALSITDQAIAYGKGKLLSQDVADMLGLIGRDEVGAVVQALAAGDAQGILDVTAELADRAVDFDGVLTELLRCLHEMAVKHAIGHSDDESIPFSAETVQLYYQIALMGYRDLQIVPDPRSGLEMTLLRMLAFIPDAEDMDKRRPSRPVNREAGTDSNAETAAGGEPGKGEKTPPAAAVDGAFETQLGKPWHDVVVNLNLSGVARMIAEHSVPGTIAGDVFTLLLDKAHDTLLNDAQVSAIERALNSILDTPVTLEIKPEILNVETPAARRDRLQAERQAEAEITMESDTTVQLLVSEFDGKLDAVRPIDPARKEQQ